MSAPATTDSPKRSFWDRLLLILAVGLGTGYARRGPGTVGSLLGPPLVYFTGLDGDRAWLTVLVGVVAFVIGIPICNAGIRLLNAKDPRQVVFDEIVAFFWVYLFVPLDLTTARGMELGLIGFLLFRAFDIVKPWPIRRFERLPQGLGVMTDDALAGLMAGVILGLVGQFWI